MAKFINPFTDIGFKRIFGQEFSKPLLLHFLNNLLVGEKEIVDLTFLDKEQPAMYADDRSLIYDILLLYIIIPDSIFIIEKQVCFYLFYLFYVISIFVCSLNCTPRSEIYQ